MAQLRKTAARTLAAVLLPLVAGCSQANRPAHHAAASSNGRYVVAVSVDGLNPDAVRLLGPKGAPTFHWLIAHGASTLNARTEHEETHTLPNHTGMVTSRPVLGGSGHHITVNEDDGSTVGSQAGHYEASMFDVVHDAGDSTTFYSSKAKLDLLDRSWNGTHGAPDVTGRDDGRDKIDHYYLAPESTNVDRLLHRLATAPDRLSFVHLAYPDSAGHASGFMSPAYVEAVRRTDALLGKIVRAVRTDSRLRRSLDLVVTADHGGRGPNHDNAASPQNYRVPFLVWGPGVARGADLCALNPSLRDPGDRRTTYSGPQPVRNGDLGNLVTGLLRLPAIPGSVFDADHRLVVH